MALPRTIEQTRPSQPKSEAILAKRVAIELIQLGLRTSVGQIDIYTGGTTLFVLRREPKVGVRAPHEILGIDSIELGAYHAERIIREEFANQGRDIRLRVIAAAPGVKPSPEFLTRLDIDRKDPAASFELPGR